MRSPVWVRLDTSMWHMSDGTMKRPMKRSSSKLWGKLRFPIGPQVWLMDFVDDLGQNPYALMPAGFGECEATLTPKRARPNMMKHFRPIGGLPAMKALGYRWLQHVSELKFGYFKTGFLLGRQS